MKTTDIMVRIKKSTQKRLQTFVYRKLSMKKGKITTILDLSEMFCGVSKALKEDKL